MIIFPYLFQSLVFELLIISKDTFLFFGFLIFPPLFTFFYRIRNSFPYHKGHLVGTHTCYMFPNLTFETLLGFVATCNILKLRKSKWRKKSAKVIWCSFSKTCLQIVDDSIDLRQGSWKCLECLRNFRKKFQGWWSDLWF